MKKRILFLILILFILPYNIIFSEEKKVLSCRTGDYLNENTGQCIKIRVEDSGKQVFDYYDPFYKKVEIYNLSQIKCQPRHEFSVEFQKCKQPIPDTGAGKLFLLYSPEIIIPTTKPKVPQATTKTPKASQTTETTPQSDYKLLAPLPDPFKTDGEIKTIDVTGEKKSGGEIEDAFSRYINILIRLSIGIIAVLSFVMIVIGGISYMISDLPIEKISGKEKMQNALLALLIAAGSYLILFTINPDLLKTRLDITDTKIKYVVSEDVPQEAEIKEGKKFFCGKYVENSNWPPEGITIPRNISATINHYGDQCEYVGQKNCTSIAGFDTSIVKAIRSACPNCFIEITGGTECWLHSKNTSHGIGSATVDLGKNPGGADYTSLNKFIENNKKKIRDRVYKIDKVGDKIRFYDEGDHWHVYYE